MPDFTISGPRNAVNVQLPGGSADANVARQAAIDTAADRVQTGLDRIATGEDREQTGLDAEATAADRTATGEDREATAEDRVQTGLDRAAAATSATQAGLSAAAAATTEANISAAIANSAVRRPTLAALQAVTTSPTGTVGEVYAETANNGTYRWSGTAWDLVSRATIPSLDARATATEGVIAPNPALPAYSLIIKDGLGRVAGWLNRAGSVLKLAGLLVTRGSGRTTLQEGTGGGSVALLADGGVAISGMTLRDNALPGTVRIVDALGRGRVVLTDPSSGSGSGSGGADFSADYIAGFDAQAMALGAGLARARKTLTQPVMAGARNAINLHGQSLAVGGNSDPIGMSFTPFGNTWMVGTRERFTQVGGDWVPVTNGNFNPLVASADVEGFGVSARNAFRRLDAASQGVSPAEVTRLIGGNTTGVPGEPIERLSFGADPAPGEAVSYWDNMVAVVAAQKAAATAEGKTLVIPAIIWEQGQANVAGAGLANTASAYAALLNQYERDFNERICGSLLGQDYPALMIVSQTGGGYQQDTFNNGVSQGQIDAALANPRIVAVEGFGNRQSDTPTNAHPTPNGHRLGGEKLAQVLHEVITLGRNWDYMRAVSVVWSGRTVLIGCNPRKPPIRFSTPFLGFTRVDPASYVNKGFSVTDSLGGVTILGVDLPGQATIRLSLSRTPVGPVWVTAGSAGAASGLTLIEDSDDTQAFQSYEFLPGMNAAANIPAEIGQRYSMRNGLMTFRTLATAV